MMQGGISMIDPMVDFRHAYDKRTYVHTVEVPKAPIPMLNQAYASVLAQTAAFLARTSEPIESVEIFDDLRSVTVKVTVWVRP